MIDLKVLRDDPDRVRSSQRVRGEDPGLVDAALAADERRRSAVTRYDALRAEQKALGKRVAAAGKGPDDEKHALLTRAKDLAAEVKDAEVEQAAADDALRDAQLPRNRTSSSNAEAAASVAAPGSALDAAITSGLAASRYGLQVVEDDIHDHAGAVTRFVLVAQPGAVPAPTGADKTSIVAFIGDDRPGALLEVLTEFAVRGINLTWIESRPTGGGLGRYCFSIDCEGHLLDARVGEALSALKRVCADVRFLGSYPRVDGVAPTMRRGTSDADFEAAAKWLSALRRG